MTVSDLNREQVNDLPAAIDELSSKLQEMIDSHNTLGNTFDSFDTAVDALTSPVTITIDTITVDTVNTALASVKGQLDTIITALQS